MVKEIDGGGQHYRSFLEERGYDLNKFDKLFFRQAEERDGDGVVIEESIVLNRLANYPDFDELSLMATDVVNTDGTDIHVLLVPKACPELKESKYSSKGEMPNPKETFFVEVWNRGNLGQRCKLPVLHGNPEEASRIAKRRFNIASNVPMKYLEAEPVLVTPDDWVGHWRYLILVKKEHCPNFVERFGDLKECVQQVRRERLANLPPAVVR